MYFVRRSAFDNRIRKGKGNRMIQLTVKIDGMQCGMCESHINDLIRRSFTVKKVSSSHSKGETIILAEEMPDEKRLRKLVEELGYQVVSVECQPYERKKFFSGLFKS